MEWLGYLCAVAIGVVLGTLGGGGSILSIPILVYLFQIDVVTASAYSLFIVGVTSLVGAVRKYRENLVSLETALIFGIPSIVSIFCTRKWIVPAIPDVVHLGGLEFSKRFLLLGIFAVMMILASLSMIRKNAVVEREVEQPRPLWLVAEGLVIGLLTGLVGAGGGFLIIPALVLLTGLPFKTAVGTSLFIISVNSLMGFLGDVLNFTIDWGFLLGITGLAVAGIFAGNIVSRFVAPSHLRAAFAWFVLASGVYILLREGFFTA